MYGYPPTIYLLSGPLGGLVPATLVMFPILVFAYRFHGPTPARQAAALILPWAAPTRAAPRDRSLNPASSGGGGGSSPGWGSSSPTATSSGADRDTQYP